MQSSSQTQDQKQIDKDSNGTPLMTQKTLRYYCQNQMLNRNAQLNDKLYLYQKGFTKIQNLHPYVNVVSLWLNNNNITKIQNLSCMNNLVCLHLNDNKIEKIEGLDQLISLQILNLQKNLITKIEGLTNLNSLNNLNIAQNKLTNFQSINNLTQLKHLAILDLSRNQIEQSQQVFKIISSLISVACINMKATPFSRGYKNYKKKLIAALIHLKFLDDRPVQQIQHRLCQAFVAGGLEEEKRQKNKIQIQQSNKKEKISYEHDKIHESAPKQNQNQNQNKVILSKKLHNIQEKQIREAIQTQKKKKSHQKKHQSQQKIQASNSNFKEGQNNEDRLENYRIEKWKKQYSPLLQALLEKHKFDFEEVQPQLNMIITEINKKLNKPNNRFQVRDLQKIWTELEIKRREGSKL